MSHQPTHRGPAPEDERLFADDQIPLLRTATSEVCWLLDRGYASRSSVELVGNRHALTERQRIAVARCACSREDAQRRRQLCLDPSRLRGRELWLDGYNVITVLESALSGGVVLLGRDTCCRDIAGIHRRYRKVNETLPVLRMVGETAVTWGVTRCKWWLDKPVSNSGRLKKLILDFAKEAGWEMEVELSFSPDHVLAHTEHVIATADGIVLDRCHGWVNLARLLISQQIPRAHLLDLAPNEVW
jgi:hypothetical protein